MIKINVDLKSEEQIHGVIKELINVYSSQEAMQSLLNSDNELNLIFGKDINNEFAEYKPESEPVITYDDSEVFFKDSEAAFYEVACKNITLLPMVQELLELIIAYNEMVGEFKIIYKDAEVPFGLTLATALVRTDKKYCHMLGSFLKTLDMDHEVYESDVIDDVLKKYGLCEETLNLIAVRAFPACGQFGSEQLEHIFETYEFEEKLSNPLLYECFLNAAKRELFNVHENHQDSCSTLFLDISRPDSKITKLFGEVRDFYLQNA